MGIKALLQYSNQGNQSVVAKYYIKIQNIQVAAAFTTKIALDELLFEVPIWARMYNNMPKDEFDINKLIDLKEAIEKYDVHY